MIFKEMDPADVRAALEGHVNVIAPEVEAHKKFFSSFQCTYCGGGVHEIIDPNRLFTSESIIPKYLAQCNDCEAQFEPYTRIELRGPRKNPLEEDDDPLKPV